MKFKESVQKENINKKSKLIYIKVKLNKYLNSNFQILNLA